MANTAFNNPNLMSVAGTSQFAEEKDQRDTILENLQNKASSPKGAASQEGALGAPASAGDGSPAFKQEIGKGEGGTGMTMLSIFMDASEEDRDALTKSTTEGLAPHGVSLEGGFLDALKKGGPHAMARAAQFGVDLEPWADKLNPEGAEMALGQAMGNIPSDENAGQPAFKTKEAALSDNKAKTKGFAEDADKKKREQRAAMSAFLTETGLRILASQRSDAGEAFGEAVLGTMDSNARKKRLAANDKMQAAELERQHGREDTKDTMAKQRRAEEAAGAERDKLEKITTDGGEIIYIDIAAGWVVDKNTKERIREATPADLSAAQINTNIRAYDSKLNAKVEKIKAMDSYKREDDYDELKGLKGKAMRDKIIELAKQELADQGVKEPAEYESTYVLDWANMTTT